MSRPSQSAKSGSRTKTSHRRKTLVNCNDCQRIFGTEIYEMCRNAVLSRKSDADDIVLICEKFSLGSYLVENEGIITEVKPGTPNSIIFEKKEKK